MKHDRREKRGKLHVLLLIGFTVLFCLSAYKVGSQLLTERKEKQGFDALIAEVSANRQAQRAQHTQTPAAADATVTPEAVRTPEPTGAANPPDSDEPQPLVTEEPLPTEVPPMLAAYESLYQRNHDLFGWLMIEGTDVNFPVMHTPWNSEYYLHLTFERTYSFSGVPFMEGNCFPGCGNYIIYGHHMKNGTVFAPIVNYASEEFWRAHPLICFDTLYETGDYEVVAAFYSQVYTKDDPEFPYYRYTDLRNPAVFEEYMAQVRAAAIYDTGIETRYGDQLITLSTCEYSVENGRFIVVARKVN